MIFCKGKLDRGLLEVLPKELDILENTGNLEGNKRPELLAKMEASV